MAFLGDLIVKMGANISPFQNALKKAQSMTVTFKSALTDMKTVAGVFSKLAASIKAVNNQMDRLIHVSRGALAATNSQAAAELNQSRARLQQLKMQQAAQLHAMKMQQAQSGNQRGGGGGFMSGMMQVAGGIGIASTVSSALGFTKDMALQTVNLAADAEVMKIQFEVMTGSLEKGVGLFKKLENFAARTSFNLESAADATKMLLATGVAESDIMSTLELLGDVSMGDSNKMAFIAKAYTDVLSKGKLQAQELRQFAENGVNIIGALSSKLGKTRAEIMEMSEAGTIGFDDMKSALQGMTAEGGVFHNMMARINETFKGQWNSLIENIQSFGRQLGEAVLPRLKELVSATNEVVQKFNKLPEKAVWLSDTLKAAFDVGFAGIKVAWEEMWNAFPGKVAWAVGESLKMLDPLQSIANTNAKNKQQFGEQLRQMRGDNPAPFVAPPTPREDLDAANKRLADQMAKLNAGGGNNAAMNQFVGPREQGFAAGVIRNMQGGNGNIGAAVGGLAEKLAGPLASLQMAAMGKLDRAKMTGNWLGELGKKMFMGDSAEPAKKIEPKLAGAMQRGSTEAFSTIMTAALGGTKDPVVRATEKQTKELIRHLKPKKQPQMLAMGAVND